LSAGDHDDLQRLFAHIQETWQHLGETEPHWSVLSTEQFSRTSIEQTKGTFYASGKSSAEALFATLKRNGLDPAAFRTCLEYGCGVGRVTRWLAARFDRVVAYDISQAHLESARAYLADHGVQNVQFHHVSQVEEMAQLPPVDVIYSVIVLQHNPPPIIRMIIGAFLRALNKGGVAYFQVPTYRTGYRFSLPEYLSQEGQRGHIEMHVLPQKHIFDLVAGEGARMVEILEDNWTGARGGEVSNTFLIQRM
jgi:2-polyprenyl-3-methyl-5-hydroxy-6-metoxy-1,4-benzoquinol methylase